MSDEYPSFDDYEREAEEQLCGQPTMTTEHEGLVARLIALADAPLPIGNDARLDLREAADELERQAVAIQTLVGALEQDRIALQAMMDAWFDYHDAHSLTRPVTGTAGNAFDLALAARDNTDNTLASLKQPGGV